MNSLGFGIPAARQASIRVRSNSASRNGLWSSTPRSAHVCRFSEDGKPATKQAVKLPYQSRKTFDELAGGLCIAPSVSVDNSNPDFTEVTVEAVDYPGLLRVIAWVMNGLDLKVHSAKLQSGDSVAVDKFWLTTVNGEKVRENTSRMRCT
jgi:UTP:GlnB (protein PII) uridylyltransferase